MAQLRQSGMYFIYNNKEVLPTVLLHCWLVDMNGTVAQTNQSNVLSHAYNVVNKGGSSV